MRAKTIQIFLKDADPEGVKIAELSNSIAKVFVLPRREMDFAKTRSELSQPALYMLFDDERTSVYIGECESFATRVKDHEARKVFWQTAVVCTATGAGLNKAKVKFLESFTVQRTLEANRFQVQNMNVPAGSSLHEFDQATVLDYFEDVALLLATLGFNVFEPLKDESRAPEAAAVPSSKTKSVLERSYDTIVSPCSEDGFETAFVAKKAWWAVRIGQHILPKLKYIGLYEAAPVSAIRVYAKITKIEPYPNKPGYYIIHHDGNIVQLAVPVQLGGNKNLGLQGSRYYRLSDVVASTTMAELTDKTFGTNYGA